MVISAKFVKKPRGSYYCDDCNGHLGSHIVLYGAPDLGDKPYTLRLHVDCITDNNPKIQKVVKEAREFFVTPPKETTDE